MPALNMLKTFLEYHVAMTRRVWDSIGHITDAQFVEEDVYSRGSLRNLMIHLASTDRRWLAGLLNRPDVGHLRPEDYPTRAAARAVFESVARELMLLANALTDADLEQHPNDLPSPRWQVILHIINHGTDHRATVLQKLQALGAPTFDQDFILWLWKR
jgi:uncharacterized damage-inducible protein DinB